MDGPEETSSGSVSDRALDRWLYDDLDEVLEFGSSCLGRDIGSIIYSKGTSFLQDPKIIYHMQVRPHGASDWVYSFFTKARLAYLVVDKPIFWFILFCMSLLGEASVQSDFLPRELFPVVAFPAWGKRDAGMKLSRWLTAAAACGLKNKASRLSKTLDGQS